MEKHYAFTEPPYSLHDMPVRFSVSGDALTLITEYGMQSPEPPYMTSSGRVVFHAVKWSESYAYILSPRGNFGTFCGEKLPLSELLERCPELRLDVMDEHFGYHSARFDGFADLGGELRELAVELFFNGGMAYLAPDEDCASPGREGYPAQIQHSAQQADRVTPVPG